MGSYSIQARRFVKQQVDAVPSPSFATVAQSSSTFEALKLNAAWRLTQRGTLAVLPVTGSENTEGNAAKLDHLDAFAYCTDHEDGNHILRMGLVAYRATLPDAFLGSKMTSLSLSLHGDPFLRDGVVVGVTTSMSEVPAGDWTGAIQNSPGKIIQGVRRTEVPAATPQQPNAVTWFAQSKLYTLAGDTTFDDGAAGVFPSAGITLMKHLYIYVALANYQRVRNAWVEGSAMMNSGIAFTAVGPGLPPDGALPDGAPLVVRCISDANFLSPNPSNLPYEIDVMPAGGNVRFGLGAAVGLDLFADRTVCQPYAEDFHSWLLGLRDVPGSYKDFILVQGNGSQMSPTCMVTGMLASIVHISGNQANSRALIRAYVKSLVMLENAAQELWLVNMDASAPVFTKIIQATVTVTPWFIPLSVLGNRHPDAFIMDAGLHKNPDFWAGRGASVGGLLKLGEPVIIPKDIPLDNTKGIRIPVTIPSTMDGVYGVLYLAPDLTDVQWVGGTATPLGIVGYLPALYSEPSLYAINGGEDVAVGMPMPSNTLGEVFRGLTVSVFNGKPSGVTQV